MLWDHSENLWDLTGTYSLVNIPKNYGKSPCLMGKSPFSIAMFVYQRLWPNMG
jgi:hypothetical protein